MGMTGKTIPKKVFPRHTPRSSREQALRKQVSILWIPGAYPGLDPGLAGMTTGGIVKYGVPFLIPIEILPTRRETACDT